MDIILFNPPRYRNGGHHKFNNALLWLASYLTQRKVKVRVVPLNNEQFEATIQREIATHRPKFAAVSCKWWDTLYSSSYIASLIKKQDPHIVTISGGHTASFFARELVEKTDFDVVVRGDGEEPLYQLVSGGRSINCVFKGDQQALPVRRGYVQKQETLKDICLAENLEDILTDISVLNSYIWTGKGCLERCVYCSGNVWNSKLHFGRAQIIYRPFETVHRDIEILSKFPDGKRITFDFDPQRGPVQTTYYLELFRGLEPKKYNCYFFSWSLPSKELVDALANTFHFVELCLDVQTGSERLRRQLGDRGLMKPFFSDRAIENLLYHINQYENFAVDMSTLMGLPFERDEDVKAIVAFSDYFYDRYPFLRYPYISPMNVEPGSLLMKNPTQYGMVLFRKSFEDFLQFTQRNFERNINCHQPESYEEGLFHPLGAAPIEDYHRGDVFRVYETWKKIQTHIDRRSNERILMRTQKYQEYGLMKVGIKGGIDRGSPRYIEVE
ncbi:MAG: cobalamin B12-binding domain-containing protein [Syntrophaceae bacterium]|nr:cobalamin B12-binding domain-containing protein [Syntrophaceae bacterium]